jgi:hypothetical protein
MTNTEPPGFPSWFFIDFLRAMGWPRRAGRFKRSLVAEPQVIEIGCRQLFQMGVVVGAYFPKRAVAFLVDLLPEYDWETEEVISASLKSLREMTPPLERPIPWAGLAELEWHVPQERVVGWSELVTEEFLGRFLYFKFFSLMMWGFWEPARAIERLDSELRRVRSTSIKSVGQLAQEVERTILDYESRMGPIPEAKQELLDHPQLVQRFG